MAYEGILEPEELDGDVKAEPIDEVEELEAQAQPEEAEEVEAEAEPKPKSRYDEWDRDTAVKNYQELEKLNSRQAQEVGTLRKDVETMRDYFMRQEFQQPSKEKELDLDSFLENPSEAINHSVTSNPAIQELNQKLVQMQQMTTASELKAKHPDFQEITQDPAFKNWVVENPVRQQLYMAGNNYDINAADYLLSEWKEKTSTRKQEATEEMRQMKAKADLSKAASEGAGGKAAQKIYRASDLMKLKMHNPDEYEARWASEFYPAYQEGRVR